MWILKCVLHTTLWPNCQFWYSKICWQENAEILWAYFESCPPNVLAGSTRKFLLIIMCAVNFYDYPENSKQKYRKNAWDNSVCTFLWSIVEELTCQLLAHVGHSHDSTQLQIFEFFDLYAFASPFEWNIARTYFRVFDGTSTFYPEDTGLVKTHVLDKVAVDKWGVYQTVSNITPSS